MPNFKILVPYNFTGNDEKAIDLVIESFSRNPDAEVTLFHTYVPLPDIEVSDKTVMARLVGNLAYLRQKISDLEQVITAAGERLVEAGFAKEKVNVIYQSRQKDTAQEIIDQAIKGEYAAIVLNNNPSKIRKYFTTSISKKVAKALMHKALYFVA
jgi:hypothetical protein